MIIPMSSPDITEAEIEAINQVLRAPNLSLGPGLAEFERRFAAYVQTDHAVAVSNGTAALHLGVIASGIGESDLVITTPFSFVASANVILYEHATPVFVDIDPQTLNIDPSLVAEAAEDLVRLRPFAQRWLSRSNNGTPVSEYRLKGILPVHAFGQPVDMDPVLETARQYELAIIEDACEAVGAEYKGRRIGARTDTDNLRMATCFAFYPNKQMTTGEGGIIVTHRDDWNVLLRSLRNQGRDIFDGWLNHSRLGYNYRLDEMSAALGSAQLSRIEDLLAKRDRVAYWYNERLQEADGIQVPRITPTTTRMSWCFYVIHLAPDVERTAVMVALKERGIPSRPYFTPIHLQPFYRKRLGYREGDFPITESVARSTLALPFCSTMTEEQVDYVCEHVVGVIKMGHRSLRARK